MWYSHTNCYFDLFSCPFCMLFITAGKDSRIIYQTAGYLRDHINKFNHERKFIRGHIDGNIFSTVTLNLFFR